MTTDSGYPFHTAGEDAALSRLERLLKECIQLSIVPQRLKPLKKTTAFGTAKAVPFPKQQPIASAAKRVTYSD
jgi:hypothetical protein